jgi:hypothetical protein
MANAVTGGTPPRENPREHRTIDVIVGRGSTDSVQCAVFGTCCYRQTALIQAFAAHSLVHGAPRKVGFASAAQAFGHREILGVLETHGLSKAKMSSVSGWTRTREPAERSRRVQPGGDARRSTTKRKTMRAIDYFDKSADLHPDRIAILDGDACYSYAETRTFSERIARGMWARGVEREQRAAIYSHNHAAVLFCMLGILRAGAAWVPINFRNAADANVEFLNYSETAWLFYHSRFREQVEEIRKRVPSLRHLICIDGRTAAILHSQASWNGETQATIVMTIPTGPMLTAISSR